MRKVLLFPYRFFRGIALLVRVLVKLAVYLCALPFMLVYAAGVLVFYQTPLSALRVLAIRLFAILKVAGKFLIYFGFLFAYCAPMMPIGGWIPKSFPFHQLLEIPLIFIIFFYAVYLITDREGRVAWFVHKIFPLPYIIVFLSWWYVIFALWFWEPLAYLAYIPGAGLGYLVAKYVFPDLARKPFLVVSFSVYAVTVVFIGLSSFAKSDCGRMAQQDGVAPVFSYCSPDWSQKLAARFQDLLGEEVEVRGTQYSQSRTVAPTPDGKEIYLSTMGRGREFDPVRTFRVNMESGEVDGVVRAFGGANDIDFFESAGIMAQAMSYQQAVQLVDMKTLEMVKEFRFPGKAKPLWVQVDDEAAKLYVFFSKYDGGPDSEKDNIQLVVIDLKNYQVEDEYSLAHGDVNRGIFSPRTGNLYFVTGFAPDGDFLFVFDTEKRNYYSRRIRNFGWDVAYDEAGGVIFVTYMVKTFRRGVVEMFREEDLRSMGFVTTEFGVRHLEFDPESNLLFTGNYITGRVNVIDPYEDKLLAHYFVGRKVRRLKYLPVTRKLYVSSANGFWEIDVSKYTNRRTGIHTEK